MWTFTASNHVSVPLQGSVLDEVFIICVLRSCRDTLSRDQLFENERLYRIVFIILAVFKSLGLSFFVDLCVLGVVKYLSAGSKGHFFQSPVQLRRVSLKDWWGNINIKLFSVAWFFFQICSMWCVLKPASLIWNLLHLVVLTCKARLLLQSQTILKGQIGL